VAIRWMAERFGAEIVTVTMDLGQGQNLEEVRDRALAIGVVRAHVLDVRDEFARDFILPALKADAVREDRRPMATALGRPLIAQKLVEIAAIEGAGAVAHGGASEGDDDARFGAAIRALNPQLTVIASARVRGMTRAEEIEYATTRDVPVPTPTDCPGHTDSNLWGRSIDYGAFDDPWVDPPEDLYALTRSPSECPNEAAHVEIAFERGTPTAINGVTMPLVDLFGSLRAIVGAHGVGRVDCVGNGPAGIRSRETYEAPAAVALHAAHKELQYLVTGPALERALRQVSRAYADLVYNGLWFTPLRQVLDAFVGAVQERVTGIVQLRLFKGDCRIAGRRSPHAVPANDPGDARDRSAAEDVIKALGLEVEISARKARDARRPTGLAVARQDS
jgi:argininosuccinate synthase